MLECNAEYLQKRFQPNYLNLTVYMITIIAVLYLTKVKAKIEK